MVNFLPQNTPEALLGRNDSKNPSTTCKGITSSGRPCRRALAISPTSSPSARKRASAAGVGGVVAVVQEDGEVQEADYYCWQHKDQAQERVAEDEQANAGRRVKRQGTQLYPLQERSSIDTLVQKLGINEDPGKRKATRPKPPRKTGTQDFARPRPSSQAPHSEKYGQAGKQQTKAKKHGFWASLCCASQQADDDYVEIVRHKQRLQHQAKPSPMTATPPNIPHNTKPATSPAPRPRPASAPAPPRADHLSPRPAANHRFSTNSQSAQLLSLIPRDLNPQTASTLFAELVKPISAADEEGYIYIFWLTPESQNAPAADTARSLLTPPSTAPPNNRRISDMMSEFSFDGTTTSSRSAEGGEQRTGKKAKTIMLKIGRANNVTRRMNEWQRQCGYALTLVRYYPHVPTSSPRASLSPNSSPSPSRPASGQVRKVSCVKKVERLIHLELAERQVKKQCEACGKEHKEWFEVDASRVGVKGVDDVVRKWVGWAESRVA